MPKKMIVMIVCHFDQTFSRGGVQKQAGLLAKQLRARGENVVLLTATRRLSNSGWKKEDGLPVRFFWTYASPQPSGKHLPAALLWAVQLLIWVALNHRNIAVLHCHQIRIHAFVATLATRVFGIPSILKSALGGERSDIEVIGSRRYLGAFGRQFIINSASCFVATANSIRKDLLEHGVPAAKVVVIPNGVVIQNSQEDEGFTAFERSKNILFLGRLTWEKNVKTLAASAIVAARQARFTLDFVGAGPEEQAIEGLLETSPTSSIRLKGWIEDTDSLLRSYGFLMLPSRFEGLSNAMIESMAAGVIPVTTMVSGAVDHIEDGVNGILLPSSDCNDLVSALVRIANTPVSRWSEMSRRASAYAIEVFDIERICNQYQPLYRQLENIEPI